jgi:hypothetical protein
MEVIERFLLNGVDGESDRASIDEAIESSAVVPPAFADSGLSVSDTAMMGAELTFHNFAFQFFIIAAFFHDTRFGLTFSRIHGINRFIFCGK